MEPVLDKIPDDVERYIESDEDKITFALFPNSVLEFFKKRAIKREESKAGIPPERIRELEEVAAVSVAVATYLKSLTGVKALIPAKAREPVSPWVLAGRQSLVEGG